MTTNIENFNNLDEPDEDLIEGIFPTIPTKVSVPRREFKPWHKPRKHLIRVHQWQAEINNLVREINFDGRPLRYISLPGDDFLDVRTVYELCESNDLRLRFLGFNDTALVDSENTLADPAFNEMVSLPLVDEKSTLAPDKFENLYLAQSMASKYLDDTGPFDILNLDLCKSFSNPRQRRASALPPPTTYDAVLSLIRRQTLQRTEPWLFFLTTRCAPNDVDRDDILKFWDCIEDNMSKYHEFEEHFAQFVNGKSRDELIIPVANNNPQRQSFTNTYCVGLGKWLLQTSQSGNPKWKVIMLRSYHYQVHSPYNMLSIAFRFERITIPPYDTTGLSKLSEPNTDNHFQEVESAINLIRATSELQDADHILRVNQTLRDEMILEQGELLHKAGYSQDQYIDWLGNHGLL